MKFVLSSSAFDHEGSIPRRYTCDGEDVSPPLYWSGVPDGARSLALIVDDPDAPDPSAPKVVWVHWILYNLPVSTADLSEAIRESQMPGGCGQGVNDWNRAGYRGPCPPVGRHRYYFKLYALDIELPDLAHPSKRELMHAMKGHVTAEAILMGTYSRDR